MPLRIRARSATLRTAMIAAALGPLSPPALAQDEPLSATECTALADERAKLQAEKAAIDRTISDIALGRTAKPRRSVGAGDVGQAVAGTAVSALLPFGLGALVNAGVAAARRSAARNKPPAPADGPDVPALIEREREIERRLAEMGQARC